MNIKIIENPPVGVLNKVQEQLSFEQGLGIVDIWCCLNPSYLLAVESGENAGVLSLSVGDEMAEVYKLYVPKGHRRKGVGRALFNHAVSLLREQEIKEIGIETVGDSGLFWNKIISDYQYQMFPEQNKCIVTI
ncbi:GNAT family N-acetyltransferase [Pseudoalteromonas sp.]|uniref:GNAT family N-acetyltransferase n=1 Tax=Pseudoalteromonas sp. TaxID=53249 RepID=UPI0030014CEC